MTVDHMSVGQIDSWSNDVEPTGPPASFVGKETSTTTSLFISI